VKIYENSKVEELLDEGSDIMVKTAYSQVNGNKVALSTNIYTPLLKSIKKYLIGVYDF